MKDTPYIAKIVECYKTGNGNYFCREEGEQESEHHLDWEIFIPENIGNGISKFPIYGIVITDNNTQFFNGKTRPTCRVVNENKEYLDNILNEENNLEKLANDHLKRSIEDLNRYYDNSSRCELALKDLKLSMSVQDWLNNYFILFNSVTIKPNGLPRITDANFNGTSFKMIQKFANIYETLSSL